MEFFKEYWQFLKTRKKMWMIPIFIVLVLASALILVAKGAAVSPFLYTLF